MKKRIVMCILATQLVIGSLAGCGNTSVNSQDGDEAAVLEAAEESEIEDKTTDVAETEEEEVGTLDDGWPWVNSDIKENINPNQEVDPRDDFHLYASMDWLSKAEIPDGYSRYTLYDECADNTKAKAIAMFNEDDFSDATDNVKMAKQLYDLYKDTDARNQQGVEPIRSMVDRLLAVESLEDMNELLMDEQVEILCGVPMNIGVGTGLEDTSTNVCWIDSASFVLGDAAEYSERTEYGELVYNYKKDLFVYMMGRLGMAEEEAAKRFDDAIAFETPIAKVTFTDEDSKRADFLDKINNEFSYEDAINHYENYPVAEVIGILGLTYDGTYMISDLENAKAVDQAYTEENASEWANLMLVKYVYGKRNYLDEDIRSKSVELYNEYMGTSGDLPQDDRAYIWVISLMPEQTSQAYVEKYSSEEDKKRIENVCYQAVDVYKAMLESNDWVSEETKKAAIDKLEAISVYVGWPNKWNDYSAIDISDDSFADASEKCTIYSAREQYSQLGKKVDKADWAKGRNLLDCNAYYDFTNNSIQMQVGMMGEPFYWSDMSDEELYASLGAFWIGHELSHAFDSNGAQWDKNGNYADWWTADDKAEFDRRIDDFIEYLDTIHIMGDYYVKGSNVDSEMVADIIGVECALKMVESEENFDYKRFFEFFSDMNSSVGLYSDTIYLINSDEHPLNYLRVNVPVQQFEEFYETYDVKEGDNMYLAPEKRLHLW